MSFLTKSESEFVDFCSEKFPAYVGVELISSWIYGYITNVHEDFIKLFESKKRELSICDKNLPVILQEVIGLSKLKLANSPINIDSHISSFLWDMEIEGEFPSKGDYREYCDSYLNNLLTQLYDIDCDYVSWDIVSIRFVGPEFYGPNYSKNKYICEIQKSSAIHVIKSILRRYTVDIEQAKYIISQTRTNKNLLHNAISLRDLEYPFYGITDFGPIQGLCGLSYEEWWIHEYPTEMIISHKEFSTILNEVLEEFEKINSL